MGLARISIGLQDCLFLGNLDAKRDWGHAKDYVRMQWMMLQQQEPEDFVIATGMQRTVREFVEIAAERLGLKIEWWGSGLEECGVDQHGRCIVKIDERYFRPTEVNSLLGDSTKASKKLGWKPKVSFDELVNEMTDFDLELAKSSER